MCTYIHSAGKSCSSALVKKRLSHPPQRLLCPFLRHHPSRRPNGCTIRRHAYPTILLQTRKREMERIVNYRYVARFLRSLSTICKALDNRGGIQGLQNLTELGQVSIALFCGSDSRVYFDYDAVQYPLFDEEASPLDAECQLYSLV